jgi:arabinose-5-phosphate isomerase
MSTPKINNDLSYVMTPEGSVTDPVALVSAPLEAGENRASLLVSAVMIDTSGFPVLPEKTLFKEILEEMSRRNLGIVCLVDNSGILTGIITDGDIRRKLLKAQKPFSAFFVDDAIDHAIKKPATVAGTQTLASAVALMGQKQIWDLPVVAANGKLEGLLHLHPAIEALLGGFSRE